MSWKVSLLRQSRTMLSLLWQLHPKRTRGTNSESLKEKTYKRKRSKKCGDEVLRSERMRRSLQNLLCHLVMAALWHLQKNISYQSPMKVSHGPTWISLCGIGRQGCQSGWRLCLQVEWDTGCDWLRELKQIFLGYFEWEGGRGIWDRILPCSIS